MKDFSDNNRQQQVGIALKERQLGMNGNGRPLDGVFSNSGFFAGMPEVASQGDQHERLTNEIKEITNLFNLGLGAASSLDVDDVIRRLFKESGKLIETENFAIALYDSSTNQLHFALVCDRGKQVKSRSVTLDQRNGLVARVVKSRAALLIHDLLSDKAQPARHTLPGQQIRSWLGVPILNPVSPASDPQGVIATWCYEPNAFSHHDLWLLSAIAAQAAIAVRNASLHEAVLAERDRVFEAEEQTRKALARDLHDGPTQLLSAISMRLDFCQVLMNKDPNRLPKELAGAQQLAKQAVGEIRTVLFELRPLILETDGLIAALRTFIDRRRQDASDHTTLTLKVRLLDQSHPFTRQDSKVEAALYAIIQEVVNNALKHAQAKRVLVALTETETDLEATVIDDGVGFEIEPARKQAIKRGSMGLVNIQERADLIGGELLIQSSPGYGTKMTIRVPKAETDRKKRRNATGPLSPLFSLMAKS